MNSPYAVTDEEQRRWSSTAAFDQTLDYSNPVGGFDHAQYLPNVYPKYVSHPGLDASEPYDYCGYGTQYQPQAPVVWNNTDSSLESVPIHIGCEYDANPSSTWPAHRSTVDFSAPYNHGHIALQVYPVQQLHATQPIAQVIGSNFTPGNTAQNSLIVADSPLSRSKTELASSPQMREEIRVDPPLVPYTDGAMPRQQSPRFDGDKYAASWVRGSGVERVGWCGFCPTWHRLKDSAYWYHMHYSHGISCVTGKPFKGPLEWRHKHGVTAHEALCGGCNKWVYIGRPERWRTPYYRHAYKCQMKALPSLSLSRSRSKSSSPRKTKLTSVRSESY